MMIRLRGYGYRPWIECCIFESKLWALSLEFYGGGLTTCYCKIITVGLFMIGAKRLKIVWFGVTSSTFRAPKERLGIVRSLDAVGEDFTPIYLLEL